MLGAPPAFVLSQDQTLYKWYLITYKVLNLCNHSDTIACVLYELLVNLELINVGFQTHDQGSTSFSFVQFSRSCCAVSSRWQLVNYTTSGSVCQELFWSFFGFFEGFQAPQNPHKLLLWAFQRLSLAGQLDYITTGCHTLSTGFLIFLTNFGRNFWAVCILWWVGVLAQVVGEDGVCRKIARASNARPYRVVVLFIATKQLQIWYKE